MKSRQLRETNWPAGPFLTGIERKYSSKCSATFWRQVISFWKVELCGASINLVAVVTLPLFVGLLTASLAYACRIANTYTCISQTPTLLPVRLITNRHAAGVGCYVGGDVAIFLVCVCSASRFCVVSYPFPLPKRFPKAVSLPPLPACLPAHSPARAASTIGCPPPPPSPENTRNRLRAPPLGGRALAVTPTTHSGGVSCAVVLWALLVVRCRCRCRGGRSEWWRGYLVVVSGNGT